MEKPVAVMIAASLTAVVAVIDMKMVEVVLAAVLPAALPVHLDLAGEISVVYFAAILAVLLLIG